jgi:lysophospholipase L1-like esterase
MKAKAVVLAVFGGMIIAGVYLMIVRGQEGSSNLKNFSGQTGKVVIAFGDGLISAQETQNVPTYSSYLAKLNGLEFFDMTVAGETSTNALDRIDSVTTLKPNYVLVTLGTEDLKRQIDLKETLDNLSKIFMGLQANGAAVLYLSVVPPMVGDNWAMAIKDVVKTHGVLWVDDVMAEVWNKPELLLDGSLPNEKGHEMIAARVKEVLVKSTDLY